jgi:hypothetical protein
MLLVLPVLSFGMINEIRVFLPTFALLSFAVAESVEKRAFDGIGPRDGGKVPPS